jgi:hypothetical protein
MLKQGTRYDLRGTIEFTISDLRSTIGTFVTKLNRTSYLVNRTLKHPFVVLKRLMWRGFQNGRKWELQVGAFVILSVVEGCGVGCGLGGFWVDKHPFVVLKRLMQYGFQNGRQTTLSNSEFYFCCGQWTVDSGLTPICRVTRPLLALAYAINCNIKRPRFHFDNNLFVKNFDNKNFVSKVS